MFLAVSILQTTSSDHIISGSLQESWSIRDARPSTLLACAQAQAQAQAKHSTDAQTLQLFTDLMRFFVPAILGFPKPE